MQKSIYSSSNANLSANYVAFLKAACTKPELFMSGLGKNVKGHKTNNVKSKRHKHKKHFTNYNHSKRSEYQTQSIFTAYNKLTLPGTFINDVEKVIAPVGELTDLLKSAPVQMALNNLDSIRNNGVDVNHQVGVSDEALFIIAILILIGGLHTKSATLKVVGSLGSIMMSFKLLKPSGLQNIFEYIFNMIKESVKPSDRCTNEVNLNKMREYINNNVDKQERDLSSNSSQSSDDDYYVDLMKTEFYSKRRDLNNTKIFKEAGIPNSLEYETQSVDLSVLFRAIVVAISSFSIWKNYGSVGVSSISKINEFAKSLTPITQIFRSGEDILTSVLNFFEYIINIVGKWFKDDFRFAFSGEIWYELEIMRTKLRDLKTSFELREDLGDVARKARAIKAELASIRVPKDGQAYVQFRDLTNQINILVEDLARFGAVGNNMRIEPFVIILSGPPGVGKSIVSKHVLDAMAFEVLKSKRKESFRDYQQCPGTYIFNPNQDEQYVSGYTNQPFVVFDDLGYSKKSLEIALPRFIAMVNTMPYMLEQAELHRKGNTFFDSKFILGNSNIFNWAQACNHLTSPDALCRRLHVTVSITCKREYATEETKDLIDPELDIDKVSSIMTGSWLDIFSYNPRNGEKVPLCHHGFKCRFSKEDCRPANLKELLSLCVLSYRHRLDRQKHFQQLSENKLSQMAAFEGDTLDMIEFIHKLEEDSYSEISLTPPLSTQSACMSSCISCKKDDLGSKQDIDLFINARLSEILIDVNDKVACSGSCCHNIMSYEFMDKVTDNIESDDYCCLLDYIDDRSSWSNDPKCNLIEYEYLRRMLNTNPKKVTLPSRIINGVRYCSDRIKTAMAKLFDFADDSFFGKVWNFIKSPIGIGLISTSILSLVGIGLYKGFGENDKPKISENKESYNEWSKSLPTEDKNTLDVVVEVGEKMQELGIDFDIDTREEFFRFANYATQSVDVNALDIMKTLASNNVMHMYKNGSYCTSVFGIGADIVLINKHVVDRLKVLGDFGLVFSRQGKQANRWTFKCGANHIDFDNAYEFKDQDLCAVQIKGLTCKEIVHLTHDDNVTYRTASQLGIAWFDPYSDEHNYNCYVGPSLQPLIHKEMSVAPRDPSLNKTYVTTNFVRYDIPTTKGMCGAPVIAMDRTRLQKLVAIHCAGNTVDGFGVRLTKTMVLNAKAHFNAYTVQYNITEMSKENVFYDVCPTKFIDDCQVIGKVTATKTALKSEIKKSPLYGRIEGAEPNLMPAILVPQLYDGVLTCPIEKNLAGYARGITVPDTVLLDGVARSYIKDLRKVCKPPRRVKFLSFEESVMGCPELPFVKSIARKTSAGFPDKLYMKNKKQSAFGDSDVFTFDTEEAILQRKVFDEAILALKNGPIEMIANIFPKDELRPKAKAKALKTRLIAGFSCSATLVIRSIFGPMIDWMSSDENRIKNSSAVGVNPASGEWKDIAMRLGFGDPSVSVKAGDYSSFDKCLHSFLMNKVFETWMEFFGSYLTEEEVTIARNCWQSIMNVLVVCKDNLIYWGNSNPSGNPLTTLINTICNILLLRYGITDVLMQDGNRNMSSILKLWDNISEDIFIICFGDDNMFSHNLNSAILSQLPPLTYQAIGTSLKNIGFTYTDELKSLDYNEGHRTVFDVNFLKRAFVKEKNHVMAPLDLDTILQKIQWMKKGDVNNNLFFEKFSNFIGELSVHEESVYKKYSKLLFDALENTLPNHTVLKGLTQDQWRELWSKVVTSY